MQIEPGSAVEKKRVQQLEASTPSTSASRVSTTIDQDSLDLAAATAVFGVNQSTILNEQPSSISLTESSSSSTSCFMPLTPLINASLAPRLVNSTGMSTSSLVSVTPLTTQQQSSAGLTTVSRLTDESDTSVIRILVDRGP